MPHRSYYMAHGARSPISSYDSVGFRGLLATSSVKELCSDEPFTYRRCSVRPNAGGRPPTPEDGQGCLTLSVSWASTWIRFPSGLFGRMGVALRVWPTLRPKSGPLFSASHRLHGSYARRDRDWQGVVVPRAGVPFRGALSPNPSLGGPHPLAKQTRLRPEAGGAGGPSIS